MISRLENGVTNPTLATLEKFVRALGLRIELVDAGQRSDAASGGG